MPNISETARDGGCAEPLAGFIHPDLIPLIQFYTIELAQLADGRVFVGVSATLCEDGDLSLVEIVSRREADKPSAVRLLAAATPFPDRVAA